MSVLSLQPDVIDFTDEQIDRIASKLCDLYFQRTFGAAPDWKKMTPQTRGLWRLLARTAIEEANDHL